MRIQMSRPPIVTSAQPRQFNPLKPLDALYILTLMSAILGCTEESPVAVMSQETDTSVNIISNESFDQHMKLPSSEGDSGVPLNLAPFGEGCEDNLDCESGYCVRAEEAGVCTRLCLGSDCPTGWGCRAISNTGADVTFVCLPDVARLCRPCSQDLDCPLGRCIELDGRAVCASDCSVEDDCLPGYRCEMSYQPILNEELEEEIADEGVGQCLPMSASCDCQIEDHAGQTRLCEESNDFGLCLGRQVCEGELGWSACDAQVPERELCDGLDNNCNGIPDDIPEIGEICESRGEINGEEVLCAGFLICAEGNEELTCSASQPTVELCNLRDDDCDGAIDEEFPTLSEICSSGEGACQRFARVRCSDDQTEVICDAVPAAPEEERCDGLDNDCDGVFDEAPEQPEEGDEPLLLSRTCYGGQAEELGVGRCLSGRQSCEGGQWGICSGEVRPYPEQCNGEDDDCDGAIDEETLGSGGQCSTGEPGRCAVGVIECLEGGFQCLSTQNPAPDDQLCDGQDEDCDGRADEDVAGLSLGCIFGRGPCANAGAFQCDPNDPTAPVICSAMEDLSRSSEELCNYVDDDCDGEADESFLNADGARATIEHCGGCGIDCNSFWPGGPEASQVEPTCTPIGESFSCGFTCLEGALDLDGVESNGCEFTPDATAIYVASPGNGGANIEGCGTFDAPCASIQYAINIATTRPDLNKVRVSDGLYRESVTLKSGVHVLGGHSAINWVRAPSLFVSVISGVRQLGERDQYALSGHSLGEAPMEVSGFTIVAPNGERSGNSYGLYLIDCSEGLQVIDNVIIGGNGGSGEQGVSGVSGASGSDGDPGAGTDNVVCFTGTPNQNPGGAGGQSRCQDPDTYTPGVNPSFTNVHGGTGGSSICPGVNLQEGSGLNGSTGGAISGSGGEGGWGHRVTSFSCSPTSGEPETGSVGGSGQTRGDHDGLGGGGCTVAGGVLSDGHWRGIQGGEGVHGRHGSGAGGGGAGGGQELTYNGTSDLGGSGGGGGSGGCAASAGQGGQSAGGSFGIFIAWTIAPTTLPIISGNRISRGAGGDGGTGGNGGAGGEAGVGGTGGPLSFYDGPIYCVFPGADGGLGARGGHGGGGGGGCGGVSFELGAFGLSGLTPPYEADNIFVVPDDQETSGSAGSGGTSNNTDRGLGQTGISGVYGHVIMLD